DPEGRVYRGFFAFRALARALPPLWPVLPLLHLPGVASLGVRVYDRVARARGRGACRAGTCRV
ncbi:MAG: DCC1-like thiol-disulfide oxidoreductase family protein, partial [Gemmatimonadota bacterium]